MLFENETMHYGEVIVTDSERTDVRYIVSQDEYSESPNEWGSGKVYVYRVAYGSTAGSVSDPDDELSSVFYRAYDRHYNSSLALETTRRYARVFLGMTPDEAYGRIANYSARGYSQGDWWDVLSITPDSFALGYARIWERWARGDVYVVTEEARIPCDSPECHGGEESHWEVVDSLCGIYADDAEGAVSEYREVM